MICLCESAGSKKNQQSTIISQRNEKEKRKEKREERKGKSTLST